MKNYGMVLKRLRKNLSISQEELAGRSSLNRSFISILERGHQHPGLNTIVAIAFGLGMKASEFIMELENDRESD
ncbi:helix-turn-helix transcriptional regulator [Neobacillus pocheonensis]|uniref:helix-turn-helix domain-containing protein n=1 Tax=Neobacillus pocheonensis TaxID=363869 RepID=UPI003D266BFC